MNAANGPSVKPFLMFSGNANEAVSFYLELFDKSKIVQVSFYRQNETAKPGSVKQAVFFLNGQEVMCIDSPPEHDFGFTQAISLFVSWSDEERLTRCYDRLSERGQVLMPLDKYDFSRKFGWVQDKFGVSWQLNLSGETRS